MIADAYRFILTVVSALGLVACASASSGGDRSGETRTVIAGADVLTMDGPKLVDRTVVVQGERIAEIRPFQVSDLTAPGDIVDARGKVLMPGLVDMHIHLPPATDDGADAAQRALAVMLAHGVTTARSMSGHPSHPQIRERIERGELLGPRVYIASPAIHVGNTKTAEEASEKVRAAERAGFDLVKSHHLPDPAIWRAARVQAEALGLATAGHVANGVGLAEAMRAGQQIEHLDGFIHALLPEERAQGAEEFGQLPPPDILAAIDSEIIGDAPVFDQARSTVSWQVPTLSLFAKLLSPADAAAVRAAPEMRFVSDAALDQWENQRAELKSAFSPEYSRSMTELRTRIVQELHAHGVPVMAGSDTTQAFHVAGPALHEEIAALAEAMGNEEALRSATVVPRDYFRSLPDAGSALGWSADFGTIEVGARADLVLLDGDPVDNLGRLDRPYAVIAAGRYHDRAALDALLAGAAYR